MDLTQLANLGEFIGGAAVLVTLIYLATQVRCAGYRDSSSHSQRARPISWGQSSWRKRIPGSAISF